jgi:hypothetical protein
MEKYCTAGQATDDSIIRYMRFACWINNAADTHSEYIILIGFHGKSGYAKAHQCTSYVGLHWLSRYLFLKMAYG